MTIQHTASELRDFLEDPAFYGYSGKHLIAEAQIGVAERLDRVIELLERAEAREDERGKAKAVTNVTNVGGGSPRQKPVVKVDIAEVIRRAFEDFVK